MIRFVLMRSAMLVNLTSYQPRSATTAPTSRSSDPAAVWAPCRSSAPARLHLAWAGPLVRQRSTAAPPSDTVRLAGSTLTSTGGQLAGLGALGRGRGAVSLTASSRLPDTLCRPAVTVQVYTPESATSTALITGRELVL